MLDSQVRSMHLFHQPYAWTSNMRKSILRISPGSNWFRFYRCLQMYYLLFSLLWQNNKKLWKKRRNLGKEGSVLACSSREHSPSRWRNYGSWSTGSWSHSISTQLTDGKWEMVWAIKHVAVVCLWNVLHRLMSLNTWCPADADADADVDADVDAACLSNLLEI